MVVARAKKNGVPYGHKTESKWGGKLTFQVNDYPDNFIPDIKKVYTQLQFILKSRTKNTS